MYDHLAKLDYFSVPNVNELLHFSIALIKIFSRFFYDSFVDVFESVNIYFQLVVVNYITLVCENYFNY